MSHNKYIIVIAFAGMMAWLGLIVVINKLSPYENMGLSLPLFFVTLLIALACTFTVVGFYFRFWLFQHEVFYKHISIALRQGIFLSLIACFCLVFQMLRVLSWWSGFFVVVVFMLLEFYFSSRDSEVAS